ncbi:MAG: hypothetical protein LAP21_06490 [Acidobacteriia bacterium]|nr:hypothetical protein [Terriglobia bacterium]
MARGRRGFEFPPVKSHNLTMAIEAADGRQAGNPPEKYSRRWCIAFGTGYSLMAALYFFEVVLFQRYTNHGPDDIAFRLLFAVLWIVFAAIWFLRAAKTGKVPDNSLSKPPQD